MDNPFFRRLMIIGIVVSLIAIGIKIGIIICNDDYKTDYIEKITEPTYEQ